MKKKKVIQNENSLEIERVLTDNTDFNTVEMYKTIRTNIMFSMQKTERGKVISITSSIPGEGKTTTSINTAITFAQMGAKVILIDCDLRRARVHRYLQLERGEGVSNILCGYTEIDKAIRKEVRTNLDVLTSGELPPNPAELLESSEFANLIEQLKEEYDYIFIDTPPVNLVADAVIVAKQCEGIIIVIRKNRTTFDMLDGTMDFIEKSDAKIIGAIMLGGELKGKKYGYYRKGKYGYKYAKKEGYDYRYSYGDRNQKESEKER